ncbi:MAG: hypothetical protein HY078_04130 [Elusimicrobia bacterium]|nr:hypothetical protein [Elusimicrobiota bacterium]
MSPGFTVLELIVGLVTAGVIAIVSAKMIQAGIATYNYTVRQNYILTNTREALMGKGSKTGILWSTQIANKTQSLPATSINVISSGSIVTAYALSGTNLERTYNAGTPGKLAEKLSTIDVHYYNINSATGLILESTAAVSASMVTVQLKMNGYQQQRSYEFYSGAQLRNHN